MTEASGLEEGIGSERIEMGLGDGPGPLTPGGAIGHAMSTSAAPAAAADLDLLRQRAGEAARLLRLIANEKRLLVLCHLVGAGEMNVGDLATVVGLSQSALSQHLAKLRQDGLVATRREAQTIHYRLADAKAARVLELLHELYCRPDDASPLQA